MPLAGALTVVGLGPGSEDWITPAAQAALADADELHGYGPYLDRVPVRPSQRRISSDNREELKRAEAALASAAAGRRVAVVSGGDPGVFAMASAVCEAIDKGPEVWRAIDIHVEPGVTAVLAAAARVGAPLGADFAVLSLSDNLKRWAVIERRLRLTSEAGLVLGLYNAASKARPELIVRALDILREARGGDVPVIRARAVGRPEEDITIMSLAEADPTKVDMQTLLIIGTSGTRIIERPGRAPLVYSERFVREA
jgi:precorrin-3B C17-methyltransferase